MAVFGPFRWYHYYTRCWLFGHGYTLLAHCCSCGRRVV